MSIQSAWLGRHKDTGGEQNSRSSAVMTTTAWEQVAALLRSLKNAEPLEEGDALPMEIVALVRDLQSSMDAVDTQTLERTVQYSINASEAMAYTAELSTHVRDTDGWAQTMSTGVEEMESAMAQLAENAKETAEAISQRQSVLIDCEKVTFAAVESNKQIGSAFESMLHASRRLEEAAEKISSFVNTIDALSKQTNLLALNATIEAARAGEAGKGFSVVASEVKSLSGQTQKATDDIRDLIGELQSNLTEVSSNVESVGSHVEVSIQHAEQTAEHITAITHSATDIGLKANETAELLQQQGEANHEIARGVIEIAEHSAKATKALDNVVISVGRSEDIVAHQFDELAGRNISGFILHKAKADHIMWKKKLAELMAGRSQMTPQELNDHHQCGLGKWYDSITSDSMRRLPAFQALLPVHEEVHRQGKLCAQRVHVGDRDGALEAYQQMSHASESVLRHIDELING